jgi:hypothetical protein
MRVTYPGHFTLLGLIILDHSSIVTNQTLIHEVINSRLNSGTVCSHSVQNLLSAHLLSKNLNIKILIHFHSCHLFHQRVAIF